MIATLESLRDIGNTVIVVEHDEDTIRAADTSSRWDLDLAYTAGGWWCRAR